MLVIEVVYEGQEGRKSPVMLGLTWGELRQLMLGTPLFLGPKQIGSRLGISSIAIYAAETEYELEMMGREVAGQGGDLPALRCADGSVPEPREQPLPKVLEDYKVPLSELAKIVRDHVPEGSLAVVAVKFPGPMEMPGGRGADAGAMITLSGARSIPDNAALLEAWDKIIEGVQALRPVVESGKIRTADSRPTTVDGEEGGDSRC